MGPNQDPGQFGAAVTDWITASTVMEPPERNKEAARAFYDLMFSQNRPAEAIDRYAGSHYTQHNPHVADGKQAFVDYFERIQVMPPTSANENGMF